MSDVSGQTGEFEDKEDVGKTPADQASRWFKEIELSSKTEKFWRERAEKVVCRYRDESEQGNAARYDNGKTRFNVLYSNVNTICPAVYNQAPKPDIRRRFRDKDPIGKNISEILSRASSYTMDVSDLDRAMVLVNKDNQLVGRGVMRIDYEGYFGSTEVDDNGEEYEPKEWEEVCIEHVGWEDFRHGPGKKWEDVTWVAYRHFMTRDALVEQFGEVGNRVELTCSPAIGDENEEENKTNDIFKRAIVWEIWDKTDRKVKFISEGLNDKILQTKEDPLNLEGFFNCPRPLYATETSDSLIPVEPFRFYEDQAKELDLMTKRISDVIDACKVRGVYDSAMQEMANLMDSNENILVPAENILQLINNGGIQNAIWMFPIEKIAQVLVYLYQQRDQIKQTIYEITGIADIMRGSSAASETLGAQQLKAQFGTMRLDDMRRDVARFARDAVRIICEIVAEHFDIETLRVMTGVEIPTEAEKMQATFSAQQMEQQGQEVPYKIKKTISSPTWEDVMSVMREDGMRSFRIDIETDSTVTGDISQEQQNMTEMLGGIASFVQAIGPAVDGGYIPKQAAGMLLSSAIRRFRMGRVVEDAIEDIVDEEEVQKGPSPELAQAQQQMQQMQQMLQQLQAENEKLKTDRSLEQQKLEQNAQKLMADYQLKKQDIDARIAKMATDTQREAMTTVTPQEQWAYDMEKEREKQDFEAYESQLDRDHEMEMKAIDVAKDGIMIMRGE